MALDSGGSWVTTEWQRGIYKVSGSNPERHYPNRKFSEVSGWALFSKTIWYF